MAESLDPLESIAVHLADAFETGDAEVIASALNAVTSSPGFADLAAAAGYPREELADALQSGALPLDMTLAIMKVIDLHLPGTRHC
jgi:probable addiction module antidote protein